jgi:hypothetical protein
VSARRDASHVVVATDGSGEIRCLHCGAKETPVYPIEIRAFVKLSKEWSAKHRKCPKPKEGL